MTMPKRKPSDTEFEEAHAKSVKKSKVSMNIGKCVRSRILLLFAILHLFNGEGWLAGWLAG
jgi:hypothetical protein